MPSEAVVIMLVEHVVEETCPLMGVLGVGRTGFHHFP